MSLIIDGYNLLYAAGIIGRGIGPGGLERSRRALLNFLAESLPPKELPRTVVVFDAHESPHGLAGQAKHHGLTVYFASKYPDADSLIEELIQKDSSPKRLTVVSSDHRLHRAARRRKATPVDSDTWFHQVVRDRRDRADSTLISAAKPDRPLSAGEVLFWLNQFGGEVEHEPAREIKSAEEPEPIDNPFPPGYAEDVFEEEA